MGAGAIKALGTGTALQVAMVVIGHLVPSLQAMGLFPIAGTLIGGITGWLASTGTAGAMGAKVGSGAIAGGVAGALGSLVSTALGDVAPGQHRHCRRQHARDRRHWRGARQDVRRSASLSGRRA